MIPFKSLGLETLPFEAAYRDGKLTGFIRDFRIAFRPLQAESTVEEILSLYAEMLTELNVSSQESYNVLWSMRLLWIVVRKQAEVASPDSEQAVVSVNSMGFAGTFFVKSQESMDFLKAKGPLWFLEQVAMHR